jgi:signal transduction histidine kinase
MAAPDDATDDAAAGATAGEGRLGQAALDDLLREVLARVEGALDENQRLSLLLDAVVTMAADLTLDSVLARIVGIAGALVDARYAALGVLDDLPGKRLRTFIHHGISAESAVEIGELPTGHGLLGLIIDQPRPLRLHDIAEHPDSYGFPAHHPPMHSFLGVPVRIRDRVFGNLYLTEKAGGADFTDQDEAIVVALAAAAGVVIENARLYEDTRRRERWLAATAEITARISGSADHDDALQVVADRAREVAGADAARVVTGSDEADLQVRAASGDDVTLDRPLALRVLSTARSEVVDGSAGTGPTVAVPMGSAPVRGVLLLAWTPERRHAVREVDPTLAASFAEQAVLALEVSQAREASQRLAVLEDRDRIGRDLHDLVIQRLFAVGLGLESAARRADDPALADRLGRAVDDLDTTIKDIRRTIFALGSLEVSTDVQSEVTRLVERAAATLKFRPGLEFSGAVRSLVGTDLAPDLLAVLSEALSNASRHAGASRVDVLVEAHDELVLTVRDDGRGLPPGVVESGLGNMRDRAQRLGGTFVLSGPAGEGTCVRWAVPLRRAR